MTSPLDIPRAHGSSLDTTLADDESHQLESISYGSNCTDLSITSRDVIVADQWTVSGKIGEGSFGEVFKVRDVKTNECYAIKRENLKTKHSQLKYESTMYDVLAGGVGIPRCYWHGNFDGFECIVMDLLGPNLGEVRQNVSSMELEIAIDLVCQMVSIVEGIHNRGVIVRDIKPDNFLFSSKHRLPEVEMIESMDEFGMPLTSFKKRTSKEIFTQQWKDKCPRIYAVDFGLACYWRDPETGKTYPDTKKHIRSKTGTARYASINVHRGRSHSRRDDVESLGYILLDLLMGTLPWTGIHARNSKAGWDRMRQLKVDTFMSDLCAGLPNGVLKFVEYPRKLQFGDQPDYEKMRQYLQGSLPGGSYADLVKSPFGGGITSTDNYDTIQQELKQLAEKQLEQEQRILDQYNRTMQQSTSNEAAQHDSDKEATTQQIAKATEFSEPKTAKEEETHSSTLQQQRRKGSTSSIQKLLKENLTKAIGWNTYKHDQAPWNPKTNWTNDDADQAGNKVARSWGDDDHKGLGTWGEPPSTTSQQDQQVAVASWGNDDNVNQGKWNEQPSWATTEATEQQDLKTTWGQHAPWDDNNATAPTTKQRGRKKSSNKTTPVVEVTWGDQVTWGDNNAIVPTTKQRGRKTSSNNNTPVAEATWGDQHQPTLGDQPTWGDRPPWEDTTTTPSAAAPPSHDKKGTMESKQDKWASSSWRTVAPHDKKDPSSKHTDQTSLMGQASSSWRTARHQPPKWHTIDQQQPSSGSPWESKQDHTSTTNVNQEDDQDHGHRWNEQANSSWAAKNNGWQQRKKQQLPGSNSPWQQKRRPLAK